ncbi:protein phosphatase 1 regulatory subunit 3B [Parasteatoda tepidariorum]|uniref:protein phosphatase 1 regulatory subunit 3B n=1 Tax=Parasteatoda tepidariorum TaxID=114398 RepID=UPI00077FBF85|nr:protein phosphatase 1 regulatory subunit 3B [Parasteatoda tepidariorum]XP_042901957.1 protein phosphatase 1 regulatory subunit 3B [Parasteatoda tepidariorum]XP_042901958.1 protein phosphatase 1 regulatory subunit 3B [Parasteatoda tepidariorum]XP_042901959.1 protein phosphatase 1 regulatory subunit 3B [Parasteatoda tepidariorum]
MPIDFEMFLSASPPIFNTATFMDFGYNPFRGPNNRNQFNSALNSYDCARDMRSCLMAKSDEENNRENYKKRVCFADDKGLALTHVKIMSEPSNCPPNWTDEFFKQIINGVKPSPTSEIQWVAQFAQPASDYMEFRDRLQKNCVSLENVIIRDSESLVSGTIKVKNIAFDKEVFLRITFDKWNSSEDVQAEFVPSGIESGNSPYDTFSFVFTIPPNASKYEVIEFCVCFKCSAAEHWDNNNGNNYKLVVVNQKSPSSVGFGKQFEDALKVNIGSWSEFASWNHLINEGPYW